MRIGFLGIAGILAFRPRIAGSGRARTCDYPASSSQAFLTPFPPSLGEAFLLAHFVKLIDQRAVAFAISAKTLDAIVYPVHLKRAHVAFSLFLRLLRRRVLAAPCHLVLRWLDYKRTFCETTAFRIKIQQCPSLPYLSTGLTLW